MPTSKQKQFAKCFGVILGLLFVFYVGANGQEITILSLETDTSVLQTAQIYEVRVMAHNVPQLWLAQLELSYDPQMIYVMGTRSGSPLETGAWIDPQQSLVVNNRAGDGLIEYTVSRLAPAENVSGSGEIARFWIYPLRAGQTTLSFNRGELIAVVFMDTANGRIVNEQIIVPFTPQLLSLTISGDTVAIPVEATATPQASVTPLFDESVAITNEPIDFTIEPTLVNVTAVPPEISSQTVETQPPLIAIAITLIVIGGGGLLVLWFGSRRVGR